MCARREWILGAIVTTLAISASARGEISILDDAGVPVPPGNATIAWDDSTQGWDIVLTGLYAPWSWTIYNIHGTGGESIDTILIDISGPPAGSPIVVRVLSDDAEGIATVGSILQIGSGETLLYDVHVTQDVGFISVQHIGDVTAGRDIIGPVLSTTSENLHRGITSLTAGRDILGDVLAPLGRIKSVVATRNIGAPQQPISMTARWDIWELRADAVHATIDASAGEGSRGVISTIEIDDFSGEIFADSIEPHWGMTDAACLRFTSAMRGTIHIGESFTGADRSVEIPIGGLSGQVVINQANDPLGDWLSPVRLCDDVGSGTVELIGPAYDATPELLGGGAVGLVPFRLHGTACSPLSGSTIIIEEEAPDPITVTLRYYGPTAVTGAIPFEFDRRLIDIPSDFLPVTSAAFTVVIDETDPRMVLISAPTSSLGFEPGFEYRLRPQPDLICAIDDAPPVFSWDFYTVSIDTIPPPPCPADISGDGRVEITDLLILIAKWGSDDPAADINGDGDVGILDLLILLEGWGACQ